jgi:hypothetical protein
MEQRGKASSPAAYSAVKQNTPFPTEKGASFSSVVLRGL